MDKELTLATPEVQDANVNSETTEETLEPATPQEEEASNIEENAENIEEPADEYDEIWNSDEEIEPEELVQNEEPEEESIEEESKPEGILVTKPLKYKGKEIYPKDEDEIIALAQKGLDYEFKMNRIKPFRKAIDIIEKSGLEPDDIQALADAKSGKAEALKYLASRFNIELEPTDEFSFEEEQKQQPSYQPQVDNNVDEVKEWFEEFSKQEPQIAGQVLNIWNELDDSFKAELYNPQVFPAFVGSVKTGEFDKVYPELIKYKALNPSVRWLDAYVAIANQLVQTENNKPKEPTGKVVRKQPKKRSVVNNKDDYDSIWDDNTPIEELERKLFG
jgi:hypothetical protein